MYQDICRPDKPALLALSANACSPGWPRIKHVALVSVRGSSVSIRKDLFLQPGLMRVHLMAIQLQQYVLRGCHIL